MTERERCILHFLAPLAGQQWGRSASTITRHTGLQRVASTLTAMQEKGWVRGLGQAIRWADGDPLWWKITAAGRKALAAEEEATRWAYGDPRWSNITDAGREALADVEARDEH